MGDSTFELIGDLDSKSMGVEGEAFDGRGGTTGNSRGETNGGGGCVGKGGSGSVELSSIVFPPI